MPKKGKGSGQGSSSSKPPAEDDPFIVFTNSTKDVKPKRPAAQAGTSGTAETEAGPPKPTVKQLIGGQSWTGKLPVNLLSEHCQKQKWERPDYRTIKVPEGFLVLVTLASKNAKTQEVTRLKPFEVPAEHRAMAIKETALEAKHFAATYALFRVLSMRNLQMALPPDYRSAWREFEAWKKADLSKEGREKGRDKLYAADPFAALREEEEAKAAKEKERKKREEARAAKEKADRNTPGAAGLALRSAAAGKDGGSAGGGRGEGGGHPMRGWNHVPRVEMGTKTRQQVEKILRQGAMWNPHGVEMSSGEKASVVKELSSIGFRRSHVEEAVEQCKDREEALEWLLLHVPEDDLPPWSLPENYTAGLSVGATDLKREGAISRLAEAGYATEICRKIYDESDGDEGLAAERLQTMLCATPSSQAQNGQMSRPADECWEEEMSSLEAVLGNTFTRLSPTVCQIRLENVKNGPKQTIDASLQFRKSPHYPAQVVVSIVAAVPSYIKLSITRQVLVYMAESLSGEEIKLWSMMDWIQANINGIIERPGKLRDIASVASAASEGTPERGSPRLRRPPRHPDPIKWTPSKEAKEQWLKRVEDAAYQKMLAQRKKLPAWQMQEAIVQTVADNQVTIISGETGSGKSTQSVQFILDDLYMQGLGQAAKVLVTQPRRISALGLADRVSEERCSQVGQEIGYSIRGESKTSAQTRITFVTTGVLLRRFQTSGGKAGDVVASLADVSHVVIDEVHERSLDTDFLLAIIRDVLVVRKDLKLILMSATLDSASFREYFTAERLTVGQVGIEGRTYPVQDYYLDDVLEMTGFSLEGRNRDNNDNDEQQAANSDQNVEGQAIAQTIRKLGHRVNLNLVAETTRAVDIEISHSPIKGGGILIFLPGVAEINQTCNLLRSQSQLHVLPLHASLETKEQRRVFAPAPPGKRKVVVATNVAETSITISDIVAVIDSGRVKETSFDPQKNMRRLEETWASRAAGKQRRGRAGRVREGTCYKLFTRNQESLMAERPEPEIRRVPLEQLCLSVRAMGIRDVASFLLKAPTPPESTAITGAMMMLQRMGALDGSELTALGTQLAMIPADLRCGKLMVFGAIFGCLDECVTLAAVLNTRSPFVSPQDKREAAKEARMRFSEGEGDLLTDLRAVQEWDRQMADRTPHRQVRMFCEENFLSWQTLQDIAATRAQYNSALKEIGIGTASAATLSSINASSNTSPTTTTTTNPPVSPMLLRALTASAFAPQIARIQFPEKKFTSSMSGAVEIDPEARTIKYFAQDSEGQQSRVFVHPSSVLFDAQSFSGGAAYISYFGLMQTSKVFVRDLTPFNAYTLLLFSGAIELDTLGRGLIVDGWLRLRGWARIGVLVSRLRSMVDDLVAQKVENPGMNLSGNEVIRTVIKLIELDGLDA